MSLKPGQFRRAKELEVFLATFDIINKAYLHRRAHKGDGCGGHAQSLIIAILVTDRVLPVPVPRGHYPVHPQKATGRWEATAVEQSILYHRGSRWNWKTLANHVARMRRRASKSPSRKTILRDSVRFAITSKVAY